MNLPRRLFAVLITGILSTGVMAVAGGTETVDAAPRPSATVVLNCARHVTYTYWPTQAPAIAVYFYDSSGVIQEATEFLYCPNGGGRFRDRVYLAQKWPQISVACFRYTGNDWLPGGTETGYEIGETGFLSLPASGTCTDDGQSGATYLGTFASWTVR